MYVYVLFGNHRSHLSAVVDGTAEAGSLTHVEHGAAKVLHMISKNRIVRVVADAAETKEPR
jgi:hypothetical protein